MSSTPTPYTRQANFEAHSTNYPTTPQVGVDMDGELNAVKTSLDETQDRLAEIQRDDGALANGLVTVDSLAAAVLALFTLINVRGTWVTATAYVIGDVVSDGGVTYLCVVAHTSGTFATDLAALKWSGASTAAAAEISFTPAGAIAATDVQAAIEELDAEKQPLDAQLTTLAALASVSNLSYLAALTAATDRLGYFDGAGSMALATFTSFARTLLDDANAAAMQATLGVPPNARTITAGAGMSGGGDLSANRTLTADIASQGEAEAGTSSTKLMTAERVAQAIAALGGTQPTLQVFTTPGANTWTRPAGCTKVKVTVVGGGAAGYTGGPGGGGGGTSIKYIDVTAISSVAVTVGAAATTSSFGAHASSTGGTTATATTPGAGGVGSSGDLNFKGGGGGSSGTGSGTSAAFGGNGGSSFLGGGGVGGTNAGGDGAAGGNYGGGGGGGGEGSGCCPSIGAAGAGAQGVVIVEEFY